MKTLPTRSIFLMILLALATASAQATTLPTNGSTAKVAPASQPKRHEAAPFVDPTLPLAGMVERVRAERTH